MRCPTPTRVAPGLTAGRGLKLGNVEETNGKHSRVAPGLTAGRGLKHVPVVLESGGDEAVAPGLTAGRGLKLLFRETLLPDDWGCARPNRRARIETRPPRCAGSWWWRVAPGLTAGRGLKLGTTRNNRRGSCPVAPGLTAGRGLKRPLAVPVLHLPRLVAPGLTAGRGLKQGGDDRRGGDAGGCARPNRRARIET